MTRGEQVDILLVEDHILLRESLARTLAAEPGFTIAGQCGSVTEALQIITEKKIDIVLLDLNLGAEQGGAFLNAYRGTGFTGRVLVVTAGVGEREAAWLRRRGCSGIFLKQNPLTELIESIHAVVRGEAPNGGAGPEEGTERSGRAGDAARKRLTVREQEVLRCVCEGLATKEIATRLNITEYGVKSFLQQLFNKTGVRTRAQLVRAAIEHYWDELGTD